MKKRNIYFLNWNSNSCFISDLPEKEKLIDFLENEDVKGFYGTSPATEEMQTFQTGFKVKIDLAVRAWFNDKKFFLHFILATGIFLISFYFLSYVVRDPIPLVDEILISLGLALLGWYRLKNQEVNSEQALLKKQELNQILNRIPFESAEYLNQIELYLEKLSSMKESEKQDMLREGVSPLFFSTYTQEMMDFRKALEAYLKNSAFSIKNLFGKNKAAAAVSGTPELRMLYRQLTEFLKNS